MPDLKPGWKRVKFGDVVRLVKETCKDPASAGIERVIGLEHLEPGDLRVRSWADIADGTTFTSRVHPGQVLFGKRRAYQRKVAVADFDAVCSGDIYVFESANPKRLLPELLSFICQTDGFFEYAVGTSAGSLSPRTNWTSLAQYEFALPPLEEQRRLALSFQTMASLCDKLNVAIATAKQTIQSAIDNYACEASTRRMTIGELADASILRAPQDGNHGAKHPKASDYRATNGIPFLMASDIRAGRVDLTECKFLDKGTADSLRHAFRAIEGDILLTHKGTLGETALLSSAPTPYVMLSPQVTAYRVLAPDSLNPTYLLYALSSSQTKRQLAALGRQSTRAFVSISNQLKINIPFPSVEEQHDVVRRVDALTSALEAIVDRARLALSIYRTALREIAR